MKIQIVIFNALFFLWFIIIALIWSSTYDLFQPGKSRVFSLTANAFSFLILAAYSYFQLKKKEIRKLIIMSTLAWLAGIALAFYPVFMALFYEPPYRYIEQKARMTGMSEDNLFKLLNGPAGSAVGEYQRWMYGWSLYRKYLWKGS